MKQTTNIINIISVIMGILIRLNLTGSNKDELNVKVLNDDNLSNAVDNMSNILANFNVSVSIDY